MNKIWTRVESITPAMAASYLQRNKVNRPLNKNNVEFYAQQMKEGKWMLNGEAIMFDSNKDLANGQTRLNAVIKAGVTVDFLVVRGVDPMCFSTYDQGRNRTFSDVFSIAGVSNYKSVSSIVNRYTMFSNGLAALYSDRASGGKGSGGYNRKITKDEMLEVYNTNAELFQTITRAAKRLVSSNVRVLSTAEAGGFYAFLVIDLHYSLDFVESYLEQLFTAKTKWEHISVLHKKLVMSMTSNFKLSPTTKTNLLAKSWNLFVAGKDSKRLAWNSSEGKVQFIPNIVNANK